MAHTEQRNEGIERPAAVSVGIVVGLYAIAGSINMMSVQAVSTSLVLMGEEMSVSIRDPLFSVEQHAQASIWSTNFGAPVYYWMASHLDPAYSLFSARRWKAGAMALLAPLVYVALRRRLGCSRTASVGGGIVVALLPGVALFAWLATENGLEAIPGVVGLLLATSCRRGWWAAPVFGALAVTTYTSGLAWAAAIVLVCLWRVRRSSCREIGMLGASLLVAVGVVAFPRLWWTAGPQRLIAGGGTVDVGLLGNLMNLGEQLAVSGRSYYYFGDQPALGSAALAVATAACLVIAAAKRWQQVWPWLAVAVITVALWIPAGNVPGVRRAVALSIVATLVLAVTLDLLLRALPHRALGVLALGVGVVALPLASTMAAWQWSYATGSRELAADFPIAKGPMPPTFERWYRQLRSGQLTTQEMVSGHDGLRTLAVVWMLAERNGRDTTGLPDPETIVRATVPPELQSSEMRRKAGQR